MVWECCLSVPIPIKSLYQVWVTMVGLPSASIDHSFPFRSGPLRFGQSWNAVQFVSGSSTHCLYEKCCDGWRVLSDCFHTHKESLPALGNNVSPCFRLSLIDHSPPKRSGTPRFGLSWNAVQFVSGSHTHRLYQWCCDCLRMLPAYSHIYNKPLPGLSNNGRPCLHLIGSFSHQRWPLRFDPSQNEDAVQFVSGSSTHYMYQNCCYGLRVLPGCFLTYNKSLPALGNNGRQSFLFNWSFSLQTWTPQIWLELKCCPIREWF